MRYNNLLMASLLMALSFGIYGCHDDKCTEGAYDACKDHSTAVVCKHGDWMEAKCPENQVCDVNKTNRCIPNPIPDCAEDSDKECKSVCKSASEGYVWKGNTIEKKTCESDQTCSAINTVGGEISCEPNGDDCAKEGGRVGDCCKPSDYKITCINANANALLCVQESIVQWDCASNSCSVDAANQLTCKKTCKTDGLPADVIAAWEAAGNTCTDAMCAEDGNAYFCNEEEGCYYFDASNGTCSNENQCTICKNGFAGCGVVCDIPCTASSTSGCAPACDADGTKGYYWSKTEGVKTYGCYNGKQCRINDQNKVECYCPDGATCDINNTCTDDDYVGTCADDHKTADVCVKGEVKHYTCFNDICETRTDGTIYCPKDQAAVNNEAIRRECEAGGKTIYTKDGSEGDCCDAENYVPGGCDEETNSGLRCSSGVIVKWTCTSPKVCHFDADSTEYVGGKYSCVDP